MERMKGVIPRWLPDWFGRKWELGYTFQTIGEALYFVLSPARRAAGLNHLQRKRLLRIAHAMLIPVGFILMGLGAGVMAGMMQYPPSTVLGTPTPPVVMSLPADMALPPPGSNVLVLEELEPVDDSAPAQGEPAVPERTAVPEAAQRVIPGGASGALITPKAPLKQDPAAPAQVIREAPYRERPGFTPPSSPLVRAEPPAGQGLRPEAEGSPARPHEKLLAIVIDDIGYSLEMLRGFLKLGRPVNFSVLPGIQHSRESALMIKRAGQEFIIHMPMEPLEYPRENPGPEALLTSFDIGEIRRRVLGYMEGLPGAVGASNHMGSAYTRDPHRMAVVQDLLAERNMFFLNSKTVSTNVPSRIAQTRNYAYLERDVFLDHNLSERAIERSFLQALARAREQGRAIAIGHPHPQTLRVLKRNLSRMDREGVRAVTLSSFLP